MGGADREGSRACRARPRHEPFEEFFANFGRKCWRSGGSGGAQELLESPFHRSRLFQLGFVKPFLSRGEARPSGEINRQVHFAPLRVPLWAGELCQHAEERGYKSCDPSVGRI